VSAAATPKRRAVREEWSGYCPNSRCESRLTHNPDIHDDHCTAAPTRNIRIGRNVIEEPRRCAAPSPSGGQYSTRGRTWAGRRIARTLTEHVTFRSTQPRAQPQGCVFTGVSGTRVISMVSAGGTETRTSLSRADLRSRGRRHTVHYFGYKNRFAIGGTLKAI